MTTTYDCIATTTVGSNQTTVTFSSISSSYTDLIIVFQGVINGNTLFRFNSNSGTIYSQTHISSNNSSIFSENEQDITATYIGDFINEPLNPGQSNFILQVLNYANTTQNKVSFFRMNNGGGSKAQVSVNLWRSTSAINTISFTSDVTNGILAGCVFTIYGIKAE